MENLEIHHLICPCFPIKPGHFPRLCFSSFLTQCSSTKPTEVTTAEVFMTNFWVEKMKLSLLTGHESEITYTQISQWCVCMQFLAGYYI